MSSRTPEQHHLKDIIEVSPAILANVASWISQNALQKQIKHSHGTNRDNPSRTHSALRKLSILNTPDTSTPSWMEDLVAAIYQGIRSRAEEYLDKPLGLLDNRYAAVAHAYRPGDHTGEAHIDQLPTVPVYISGSSAGGLLHIAKNPEARTLEEIMADSYRITPQSGTYVLFDGTQYPHVVEGLPGQVDNVRTSVNFTYLPLDGSAQLDPNHPRIRALAN